LQNTLSPRPALPRSGILYQDDGFGGDHINPSLAALGDKANVVVAKQSSVRAMPLSLPESSSILPRVDTLYLTAQGRAAAQPVAAVRNQPDWNPPIFMFDVATAKRVAGTLGDKLTGVMLVDRSKDPTNPGWAEDSAVKDYPDLDEEDAPP
jgi:hypothetical protein